MKKKFKLIVLAALCLALVIGTCAVALAIDPRNVDEKTSLTVNFWLNDEDVPAPGVEFRLYYVADVDEFCNMTVVAPFTGYGIDLSKPTQQTYRDIEAMLPGNIAADGIAPNYIGTTDENGAARFEDIPAGLYLVVGDQYHANRHFYTPDTTMVCLPNRLEDESWDYDVSINIKYESRIDSEPVDIEVLKVWKDNDNKDRPASVTIELYDGNELIDTVVLNKDNNWTHKWEGLYGGGSYSVKEKVVPSGYTHTIQRQGNRFVVTNKKESPPDDNPPPDTGLLWWPVPILVVLGLALFAFGWSRNMSNKRKDEE